MVAGAVWYATGYLYSLYTAAEHSILALQQQGPACPLPSQQIEDVDDAATYLHYDMASPDELEARQRGLRQASQVQVACNCRLRAAEQPDSLQHACSRAASVYSAPKGTFFATL